MHIAILTGGISSERSVALRSAENMKHWIQIAGYTSDTFDFPDMIPEFLSNYQTFDLVIPMFHGIYGEDGQITAFLRTLGCQYAFSPFTTHALCLDKYRTNLFVEAMGIHIPRTLFLPKDEPKKEILAYAWVESFPYIIKPNR